MSKAKPNVEISISNVGKRGFDLNIVETDLDEVGLVQKIELLYGETSRELSLDTKTIGELYSDNDYGVRVTYEYDLNDGAGTQSMFLLANTTTLQMATPEVKLDHLFVTENSIKADLKCDDPDGVMLGKTVKLTGPNNRTLLREDINFTDLAYGETYDIAITFVYDLNDNTGEKSINKSITVTIDSKSIHETSCILDHKEYADSYRITGYSNCHHDEIYIPETIDGVSVVSIGAYAFKDCTAKQIEIGKNVYEIEERAFWGCLGLTEFTIPENIMSIGSQIFIGCKNLKTVYYNSTASRIDSVLNISSIDTVIFGDNLIEIPGNVCYNCTNIKTVIISEKTQRIGGYAFFHCTGLTQIELPEGLISTGFYAFEESGLTSLMLPSTVTDVANSFRDCIDLTYVVIPVSLRKIEGQAFYGCNALEAIFYMGNDFEWEVVSVDPINDVFLNTPVYFYSNGRPQTKGNFWYYAEGVPTLWFEEKDIPSSKPSQSDETD